MIKRSFQEKQRNRISRKRKPIIVIVPEGNNVTEAQYFKSFHEQQSPFIIQIEKAGSGTDPQRLFNVAQHAWDKNDMRSAVGDVAFVVLDLDCSEEKADNIKKLIRKNINKSIQFIVSNPCFELWFMLHFTYSAKSYYDSKEILKDLRKYIPAYDKNSNVALSLRSRHSEAMLNAERLVQYHRDKTSRWPSNEYNPMTDVHLVFKQLRQYEG